MAAVIEERADGGRVSLTVAVWPPLRDQHVRRAVEMRPEHVPGTGESAGARQEIARIVALSLCPYLHAVADGMVTVGDPYSLHVTSTATNLDSPAESAVYKWRRDRFWNQQG